jgi:hypothetical protein
MCITMSAAQLSGTRLFAGQFTDGRRSLIYQCSAESEQPNTLMFVVPTKGKLGEKNFINLEAVPELLDLFVDAYQAKKHEGGRSKTLVRSLGENVGFAQVGGWAVTYSNGGSYEEILALIESLPADKRPEANPEVIKGFADLGLPFVIAGFAATSGGRSWGSEKQELHPLGLWYTDPIDEDYLSFPMLDGHGSFPKEQGRVMRDHYTFASIEGVVSGESHYEVNLASELRSCPELLLLIPFVHIDGAHAECVFDAGYIKGLRPNGDLAVEKATLYSKSATSVFFMPGSEIA